MTDGIDAFWADRFHWCTLAAGFIAASEGRLQDSDYVRQLAYQGFQEGSFAEEARGRKVASKPAANPTDESPL